MTAASLALNQRHFERLTDEVLKRAIDVYQRSLAVDFVDDVIRQATRSYGVGTPAFDDMRRRAMHIRTLGAVRSHFSRMVDAARAQWTPEEKLKEFVLKPHLNRAAFYARDQTGFLFGQAQRELAMSTGAVRYKWLRTSSKNPRDIHLNRVGKIYRFGELSDEPGVLPNCKCSLEPVYG